VLDMHGLLFFFVVNTHILFTLLIPILSNEAADTITHKITSGQILEKSSSLCGEHFHEKEFLFIDSTFTFNTPQLLIYSALF